jgi:hypothetical protein
MADMEFDLGEAMGSYEQAQADRAFYNQMIQQGNTREGAYWMSPIAAYLSGVANVKMAQSRAKIPGIQDERQAEKDATAAAERTRKYQQGLLDNLYEVTGAANRGEVDKGAAAAIAGHIIKELGYTPTSYAADKGILGYEDNGIPYEIDLSQKWVSKKQATAEKGKGGSGSGKKYTTLSSFKAAHKPIFDKFSGEIVLEDPTKNQIDAFIRGSEELSPADREQVQGIMRDAISWAQEEPRGWEFSTQPQGPTSKGVLNAFYK